MRSVMRACIGSNRAPDGRYAEIDLPASPYRLLNALDEIGIKSTKEIVYQEILNYGSFGYLEPHFDEYTMLEELNALAQKLAVFDRVDSIAFEGLVKMAEQKPEPFGVKELINFAHSTESCHVMLDALYNIPDEEDGYADYLREKRLNLWYRNGGDVTHRYLKHIRKSVRQEILEYLDKLPVNIEIMVNGQKYLLTHAAPEDEYLNSSMKHRDGREFAVWHRYRSHDRGPDDYTVIFGHTPTTEHQLAKPATIWNGRNLIDIDCGAAYEEIDVWGIVIKTRLACLRLDDMKEFYSEEDLNEEGNQRR